MNEEIKKTGPKDVFLNLLAIISFYVCVVFFSIVVFNFVDFYFPDPLRHITTAGIRSNLRWPISVLAVAFPFYVWVSSFIQKDIAANLEKKTLKTRKWLLYFTLFVAIITMAGDFVTVVYQFLNGSLTVAFLLKILTVLLIAVAAFFYYGWILRKETPPSSNFTMKWFIRDMIILGAVVIILGFYVVGLPQSERLRQFDQRRINDLSNIQFQIVDFWQTKGKLPQSLGELKNDITGFVSPTDPETGLSYEYKTTGNLSFELCAIFKTSNKDENEMKLKVVPIIINDGFGIEQNWAHDIGRTCFSRTIDPDRFPTKGKILNIKR